MWNSDITETILGGDMATYLDTDNFDIYCPECGTKGVAKELDKMYGIDTTSGTRPIEIHHGVTMKTRWYTILEEIWKT